MGLLGVLSKKALPSRLRRGLDEYLLRAGIESVPYDRFGLAMLFTVPVNLLVYALFVFPRTAFSPLALLLYALISLVVIEVLLFALLLFFFKLYFDVRIYGRTVEINRVLPDFLERLRNNLAAGESFNRALMRSVHDDSKVLNEEVKIVAKKVSTGEDSEQALQEFAKKYDSPLVEESVDILVLALRGGANVVEMLDKLVESIRIDRELRQEVRVSVANYVIFITMIALVISPVLFALSLNLLNIFTSFGSRLGAVELAGITFSSAVVAPSEFILFSRISVAVISLFAGMIIAKLKKGALKAYLPQIVVYVAVSIIVYELARMGLGLAFSGIA